MRPNAGMAADAICHFHANIARGIGNEIRAKAAEDAKGVEQLPVHDQLPSQMTRANLGTEYGCDRGLRSKSQAQDCSTNHQLLPIPCTCSTDGGGKTDAGGCEYGASSSEPFGLQRIGEPAAKNASD